MKRFVIFVMGLAWAAMPLVAAEEVATGERIDYEGEVVSTVSTGDFAPMYMSAMSHGVVAQGRSAFLKLGFKHELDTARRFSWGYGVKGYGGVDNGVDYERFDAETGEWGVNRRHQSRLWLQELYGQVKFRSLFLSVGLKEQESPILNQDLTSGDLILSGNTRPLPGVRAGFVGFRDIPLTKGWAQVEGQLFYGKYTDGNWWADHFNYYNGHVGRGQYNIYRRLYLRSKPSERFSVTLGVQCASMFGGYSDYYNKGELTTTRVYPNKFLDFLKMFIPTWDGTEGFVQGNTLGTWDFKARYRMRDNAELSFYFQWPWEDGSGMGKLNGFDGLWGLEYDFPGKGGVVEGVVLEFLDLTNQSGPMHWGPADTPGTSITMSANGADDYYNNFFYNSYAYYGLSMGSPMVMAPIYNRDGYMGFVANRVRGFHLALKGRIAGHVDYRVKLGHRKAWGNGMMQLDHTIQSTSLMAEGRYAVPCVKGLSTRLVVAFDNGTMPASTFGVLLGVSYNGFLTLGHK